MNEYIKRIPIQSNLSKMGRGYNYLDVDTVIKNSRQDSVDRTFVIKNLGYEMFVYITYK